MGTPQSPNELIDHQCLVYNLVRDFEHWQLYDANKTLVKVKVRPTLKAGNGEFLRDAALSGQGIVLLPTFNCLQGD